MFQEWQELTGSVLENAFEIGRVVRSGKRKVWFEGRDRTFNRPVSIQAFRLDDPAELKRLYLRFQEASFIDHPHLLRILSVISAEDVVYVVSERGEYDLPQFIEQRPMPVEDATELTSQLVSALGTLHTENLVYGNLSPETVWKIGNEWKLSDFSQLRVAGNADGDGRRILSRLPSVPPEVFEGVISPAWDVWSLGTLLQRVLTPSPTHVDGKLSVPRSRHLRMHGLPAPFDRITRECLQPDPRERASLPHVEQLLSTEPQPQTTYLIEDPPSRGRAWLAFALGVLVVVVIAVLWALRSNNSPVNESGRARTNAPVATFGNPANQKALPAQDKPSPVEIPPVQQKNGDGSIENLLERWAQATRNKDAAGAASFYAPRVKTFYGKRNLTREEIQRDRERTYKQIGSVRRFEISNVQVTQLGKDSAVALFDKTWQFGTGKAGAVREQLSFGRYGGGWKITNERELKVYR